MQWVHGPDWVTSIQSPTVAVKFVCTHRRFGGERRYWGRDNPRSDFSGMVGVARGTRGVRVLPLIANSAVLEDKPERIPELFWHNAMAAVIVAVKILVNLQGAPHTVLLKQKKSKPKWTAATDPTETISLCNTLVLEFVQTRKKTYGGRSGRGAIVFEKVETNCIHNAYSLQFW